MALSEEIRRVVTSVDADGKAVVLFDGDNPHKVVRPNRSVTSRLLWVTGETPADMTGPKDRAAVEIGIAPAVGGSIFRVIDIPPTPPDIDKLGNDHLHKQIGDHAPPTRPAAAPPADASNAYDRLRHHHAGRDRHAAR
jgi:hypothetical protein